MDSDSDSETQSTSSLSAPPSPTLSLRAPPTVERLVQHFVAAKRSLNAIWYGNRANELVQDSRKMLEEIAILNARNTFIRRGADEEVDTLYAIRDQIADAGTDAADEFDKTLAKLDVANDRLQKTLAALKKTIVDTSLQRRTQDYVKDEDDASTAESEGPAEQKTLYDFISEDDHMDLDASVRKLIDSFNDSRADLNAAVQAFDGSLNTINATLSPEDNKTVGDSATDVASQPGDEPPPTIPDLFNSMYEHAREMAGLLGSLVSHYDLCVTALKHTEGGGEAARRAVQQAEGTITKTHPDGDGVVEESLYLKTVPEPISDEERSEMLRVLENDAQEVDDVVAEIKNLNQEQEKQFAQLHAHASSTRSAHTSFNQGLDMLHDMRDIHLPSHLHALTSFQQAWKHRIHPSLKSQTSDLASLSTFYDGFFQSYSKLLREVERRKAAEEQMRKVAEKAQRDIQLLFESERQARADFMDGTGKFLPRGIWEGLDEKFVGARWEVREVGSDE